jgi:hypothetical protein
MSRLSNGMATSCSRFSALSELRLADLMDPKNDFRCGFVGVKGTGAGSRAIGSCSVGGADSSVANQSGSSSITSWRRGLASREDTLLERLPDFAKWGRGGARGSDEAESGGVDGKFRARCSCSGMPSELLEDPITP